MGTDQRGAHILTLYLGLCTFLVYTQHSLFATAGTSFVEITMSTFFPEMLSFLDFATLGTFFRPSTRRTPDY